VDIILIAAVTQDGFIARHPHETIRWSKDLSLFKEQTTGWPVIMGSNTFNCINRELKDRKIIVMHREDRPKGVLDAIDKEKSFIISGTGDVLEPEDGIIGIGSGGNYALAAAKVLMESKLTAEEIAKKAISVAAEICVYTNNNITVEKI